MENKYYTPDIEDIHIGYECEIYRGQDTWTKYIFQEEDLFGRFYEQGEKINLKKVEFRTPYLTKEQIESKGWEIDKYSFIIMDITNNNELGDEHLFRFFKNEFSIIFHNEKHTITIRNKEDILYSGKCLSINEFRKICKLIF